MTSFKKKEAGEADPVVTPHELVKETSIGASSVSRWLRPAIDAGLIEVVAETAGQRIRSVRPVSGGRIAKTHLPSMEDMAGSFPQLARGFRAVHPLTGEEVVLEEETGVENCSPVRS